jgi:hypothetical protein
MDRLGSVVMAQERISARVVDLASASPPLCSLNCEGSRSPSPSPPKPE